MQRIKVTNCQTHTTEEWASALSLVVEAGPALLTVPADFFFSVPPPFFLFGVTIFSKERLGHFPS